VPRFRREGQGIPTELLRDLLKFPAPGALGRHHQKVYQTKRARGRRGPRRVVFFTA